MKSNLINFEKKYSDLSNFEFEKAVLDADKLNPELISILVNESKKRNKAYFILEELEKDYKNKGYPDFFDETKKEDISNYLKFLKSNLPKKPTKNNYQLSDVNLNLKEIFTNYGLFDNLQGRLQKVADIIRNHMEINEPIKIIILNNIEAGKFEMIENLNCIYINSDTIKHTLNQKIAILIHEMSHYYLMRKHGIFKKIEKENELLTEINAIYCGFGFYLLKGYKEQKKRFGNQITKSKVGYINQLTIKETIVQTAYLRKQKPSWILKNSTLLDKPFFYFKLRKLTEEYKRK